MHITSGMEAIHTSQPYDVSRSSLMERERPEPRRINVHRNERIVSSLLGGLVLARAFTHRSRFDTVLGLLGSALVYRGVSGHCELYRMLGMDTAA